MTFRVVAVDPRFGMPARRELLGEFLGEGFELVLPAAFEGGADKWFDMARSLDHAVQGRKGVIPNVDFYSAPLWRGLGIPMELFVPVIAISRVAGWTAHILERRADNRPIRPRARHAGPSKRPCKTPRGRG